MNGVNLFNYETEGLINLVVHVCKWESVDEGKCAHVSTHGVSLANYETKSLINLVAVGRRGTVGN